MRFILFIVALLLFHTGFAIPVPDVQNETRYECRWTYQQHMAWVKAMVPVRAPFVVCDTPIIFICHTAFQPAQLLHWATASGLSARPGPAATFMAIARSNDIYKNWPPICLSNSLKGKAPFEDNCYRAG